jgi:hypothetical protein
MTSIPFFHYTALGNLDGIIQAGAVRSREHIDSVSASFDDISIDPSQSRRVELGLTGYVPAFAGFYARYRGFELNGYLRECYDRPRVQNPSFYGSLNKTLQRRLGRHYAEVVILMIDDELVLQYADQGKLWLFTDIAIKREAEEIEISSREELLTSLSDEINYGCLNCEVDLLDDGEEPIALPGRIEAIIVDNDAVASEVRRRLASVRGSRNTLPEIFVSELPRNPS